MALSCPVTITMKDLPHSRALEQELHDRFEKLSHFYDRIIGCAAVIKVPQKRKHQGKIYNVRLEIKVPGSVLAFKNSRNEDIYLAIRDAFLAAEKTLKKYSDQQRGYTKTHDIAFHGTIERLYPVDGFGFIECNGSEYYFTFANVAHPDFDVLSIGDEVQFIPAYGDEGLQANRVTVGKHHFVEWE